MLLLIVVWYLFSLVDGIVGGVLGDESLGCYLCLGIVIVVNGVEVELCLCELDG